MNTGQKFTFAARAALVISIGITAVAVSAKPISSRGYSTGHFALELDGEVVGWVSGVEGGHLTQDVVTEALGDDHILKKSIGGVKYQEISLRCGTGMSAKVYDWIKAELAGDFSKHSGAIVTTDFNFKPKQRLEFQNGLLSVVEFPSLDAGSKGEAYLYLKISPQSTKFVDVKNAALMKPPSTKVKPWGLAHYRLTINGTELEVTKIDALVIKEKFVDSVGNVRNTKDGSAGEIVYEPLEFFMFENDASALSKIFAANLIKPESATGKLEFMGRTTKDVFFTLTFPQLRPFKMGPDKKVGGGTNDKRDEIQMTIDKMGFEYKAEALAMGQGTSKSTS